MRTVPQAAIKYKRALESAEYARQGYSVKETAQEMNCSVANVKALRVRFMDRMHSRNMPQAVSKAQSMGLFARAVLFVALLPLIASAVLIASPDQNNDQARLIRRVKSRREFDVWDLTKFLEGVV